MSTETTGDGQPVMSVKKTTGHPKEKSNDFTNLSRFRAASMASGVFRRVSELGQAGSSNQNTGPQCKDKSPSASGSQGGGRTVDNFLFHRPGCDDRQVSVAPPSSKVLTHRHRNYKYPAQSYNAHDYYHHHGGGGMSEFASSPQQPLSTQHAVYYQTVPVHTTATHSSSSLESQGSSPPSVFTAKTTQNQSSVPTFGFGSVPPPPPAFSSHYPYHSPWTLPPPPLPPVEYIHNVATNDVLCGRGGATNSHVGNRSFRNLVKRYQDRYLQAKKRDKPAVASTIVDIIRNNGGRFLRRCESNPQGQILWVEIGVKKATEKTCQALREGAPEIRRKTRTGSSDDDDSRDSPKRATWITSMQKSIVICNAEITPGDRHFKMFESSDQSNADAAEGPIVIRPFTKFMLNKKADVIALDDLPENERNLYLQEFLPPHPNQRRLSSHNTFLSLGRDDSSKDNNTNECTSPWPVISV